MYVMPSGHLVCRREVNDSQPQDSGQPWPCAAHEWPQQVCSRGCVSTCMASTGTQLWLCTVLGPLRKRPVLAPAMWATRSTACCANQS